jgi:hypothetical protein
LQRIVRLARNHAARNERQSIMVKGLAEGVALALFIANVLAWAAILN